MKSGDQRYIAITGAHSTGKSTLAAELTSKLKQLGYSCRVIEGITRSVAKRGLPISQESTAETYCANLAEHLYQERIATEEIVICNRFSLDCLAYALANGLQGNLVKLMEEIYLSSVSKYCVIFYLPIEFGLVVDGMRPTDDLPPKKESSYNVSKFGQKEGG